MSKKSKKKIIKIDAVQGLRHLLHTECHCTEEQVEIIDAVLQNMIPADDVEPFTAIYEGRVTATREMPHFILDMGNGESKEMSLNVQHPQMLLLDYLETKYGHRFGTLYWFAIGSNHKEMYTILSRHRKAPVFAHLFNGDKATPESEAEG